MKNFSPVVKRELEVSALQDLTRVTPRLRWRGTPEKSLHPKPWYSTDGTPYTGHSGVDGKGNRGDAIYSIYDGKVWIADDGHGWKYIHITTKSGCVDRYYHCDTILVKTGDVVKAGQKIGTMGDKGLATGVHIHLGSSDKNGLELDAYPRLFGFVDEANKEIDPKGSKRNAQGLLLLADTDPYETEVQAQAVAYRVSLGGESLRVRTRPGTNFEMTGELIPDGTVIEIDKWCSYDYNFTGTDYAQSWGRLKGRPWNWVALKYGSWNVKRA